MRRFWTYAPFASCMSPPIPAASATQHVQPGEASQRRARCIRVDGWRRGQCVDAASVPISSWSMGGATSAEFTWHTARGMRASDPLCGASACTLGVIASIMSSTALAR